VKVRKGRRGISPLLATVILIAITVAAGLTIYHMFFSTVGVAGSTLSIQVVSIDLIKTGNTILVSASIKNTGSKPISSLTVTIHGDSGTATITLSNIDPGETASNTVVNPSGFSVTVGKSYPVKITATATDGSMLDKSMSVVCSS